MGFVSELRGESLLLADQDKPKLFCIGVLVLVYFKFDLIVKVELDQKCYFCIALIIGFDSNHNE